VNVSDPTGQFTATGCSGALGAHQTCSVTVTFAAKRRGSTVASIAISDGADTSDVATASVSGIGQAPAKVAISPSSYTFPPTGRNGTSAAQTFTVSNTGDIATGTLSMSRTTNGAFTIITDGCNGKPLSPATPCSVQVDFAPSQVGPVSGQLEIHDASTTLATASLSGTGTPIWVREYSSASLVELLSVWAAPDHRHAWAGGFKATILNRQANGTWTADNNGGLNSINQISGITGSSVTDLWAVGYQGYLRSTGNGNWIVGAQPNPNVGGYFDVFAVGPNDVWLATQFDNNDFGALRFNGDGFVYEASGSVGCQYLWGTSDNSMFCSYKMLTGDIYGQGGVAKRVDPSGFKSVQPLGDQHLTGKMWGSSPADVYIVVNNARPYHSTPGGWVEVDSSAPSSVSIWGTSATNIYLGTSDHGVAHGNGTTWDPPFDPLGKQLYAAAIHGVDANDFYVVGSDNDGGCIYHYF
jgi:hypothetical protein